MSDEPGYVDQLWLSGYVALSDHGFALPVYGAGPQANAWYVAVPTIDGDHLSAIAGFNLLEDEDVQLIWPVTVGVRVGDPWQDVFLWDGDAVAGSPKDIFERLLPMMDPLRQTAPLSLLDLATACESSDAPALAREALAFLQGRLGAGQGIRSFQELVIRPAVMIAMRRLLYRGRADVLFEDFARAFVIRETGEEALEISFVPGTAKLLVGDSNRAEIDSAVNEAGLLLGLSLNWKERGDQVGAFMPEVTSEAGKALNVPLEAETGARQTETGVPLPNILIITADRRARQIARFIEAPHEIAFGSRAVFDVARYSISHLDQAEFEHLGLASAAIHICQSSPPMTATVLSISSCVAASR